ncbi:MAG: PAS domain-containing protein, partial [Polyangiaceae bacterium]
MTVIADAEARFTRLSESGLIGVVIGNLEGRIVEINDTALELLGYARDEVLAAEFVWFDLTPPEWRSADRTAVAQLSSTGVGALREKEYLHKSGRRVPVLVGSAMVGGDTPLAMSF